MTEAWDIIRDETPAPQLSLIDDMYVERGDLADWRLLQGLHYKQAHNLPAGAHEWRLVLRGETIGVLMFASPKLLLKERHVLFPNIKPGKDTRETNRYRMQWLNANMQVVSRVVVDTMFRGVGLAYRFTNLCCRLEGKKYLEIQSSMSKYNMFAHKAGFRFVKPMRSNKYEAGMKFFRSVFDSDPNDLEALIGELLSQPEPIAKMMEEECRQFYLRNSAMENTGKSLHGEGAKRVARMSLREVLTNLQQMTLASPLYGCYTNPDFGRTDLPARIPLSAFDRQATDKPLILE